MNQQDNMANQRPTIVQCKCGWVGLSDKLERRSIGLPDLACPKCWAKFEPYPPQPSGAGQPPP